MDPFSKLHSDTGSLLHEAESRPGFQQTQDEAKQRRMAQVVRILRQCLVFYSDLD